MSNESVRLFPSGCLSYNGCYRHISSCDGDCMLSKNRSLWSDSQVHKVVNNDILLQINVDELSCPCCHDTFHTLDRYVQHINGKRHIKNYECYVNKTQFICTVCKHPTTSQSALAQHALKHVPSSDYFCKICGRSFDSNVSLLQHLDTPAHTLTVKFAQLPDHNQ